MGLKRRTTLTSSFGLTILQDIRREIGLSKPCEVEMEVNEGKDCVIIRRVDNPCYLCGGYDNIKTYGYRRICRRCADRIYNDIKQERIKERGFINA